MGFEEKTEFKPCWGVIFSYCPKIGSFGHCCVDLLNHCQIDTKPEIAISTLNQIIDVIHDKFNDKFLVILNFQLVWIDEPLRT